MTDETKNGTISLVMGILSLVIPLVGFILGILAIVYWNKQKKIAPSGTATAGLVLGIIGIVWGALFFIFIGFIGFNAYFGVLRPDKFLPDKCTVSLPLTCTNYKATSASAMFYLRNSGGYDIHDMIVTTTCAGGKTETTTVGTLPIGQETTVRTTCTPNTERTSLTFDITYSQSGIKHNGKGALQARPE